MVEVISKSISMRGTDSDNVSFYEIVVNISHTIIEAASVYNAIVFIIIFRNEKTTVHIRPLCFIRTEINYDR